MTKTKRSKRPWTQKEVRQLEQLADRKVGCEQIASELDRSPASVKLKAYWLNLSLDPRNARS